MLSAESHHNKENPAIPQDANTPSAYPKTQNSKVTMGVTSETKEVRAMNPIVTTILNVVSSTRFVGPHEASVMVNIDRSSMTSNAQDLVSSTPNFDQGDGLASTTRAIRQSDPQTGWYHSTHLGSSKSARV